MLKITSYTKEKVYFKEGGQSYDFGEILTHYLNLDMSKIEKILKKMNRLKVRCRLPQSFEENVESYNADVYRAQSCFTAILEFLMEQPPYNSLIVEFVLKQEFFDLLNKHFLVFVRDGFKFSEWRDKRTEDMFDVGEYGYGDAETWEEELFKFVPDLSYLDATQIEWIMAANEDIDKLFEKYIALASGLCRVKNVYSQFIDECINASKGNVEEIEKYMEQKKSFRNDAYGFQDSIKTEVSYGVMNEECKALYKMSEYDSVIDFLYIELMDGIFSGIVPRRCKNCELYFLQTTPYQAEYCERIAPGETEKTCREVGARNSFENKVKNDPVWQTYHRAYKTHYARMLKKKMTKEEFFVWGEYAVGLREKALAGELEFDDYVEQIKK